MADFDPDVYLSQVQPQQPAFDPDAYLATAQASSTQTVQSRMGLADMLFDKGTADNLRGAVQDVVYSLPGMVAQLPKMAYEGLKFAVGGPQERAQVGTEALTEAVVQGQQMSKDVMSPLGSRESFRGIANLGLMAAPAVGEALGEAALLGESKPPIQTEIPTEGIENAQQIESATRPNVDVQLPGGEAARETDGGQVPAPVSGEGVQTGGQGETLQTPQEVAPSAETPTTVGETTTTRQAEPVEQPPPVSESGLEPSAPVTEKGIAEAPTTAAPEENPITYPEGEGKTTGIAQRITNVPANEGLTVQESVDRGQNLLSEGVNPEEVSARVKTTKQLSVDDLSVLRARTSELDKAAYAAEDAMRANPKDPLARQAWEDAVKARNDWNTDHVKPAQTIWSDLGRTQQGEADIDTGTVTGLRVAFNEAKGRDPTPTEQAKLTDLADRTQKASAAVSEVKSRYDEIVKKETADLPSISPDQLAFGENFGVGVNPKSGITDLTRIIWKVAKDGYIDKGVTSLDDTIHGVALDTGLKSDVVRDALTKPKAIRQITNEMYAKMSARRNMVNAAKDYINAKDEPTWKRVIKATWDTPFSLAIYGHGTVGGETHAGANIFRPSGWKAYWPDFVNQAKFFARPSIHEAAMQKLVRDPNFITAKRGGLANDPNLTYTDYGAYAKFFGLQGGRRGFDALKTMRQSMFNAYWEKIPDSVKSDPAAAKEMARGYADTVNHATGVISNSDRGFLATAARAGSPIAFAAKLEASRWARVIGDPLKTADTFARWDQATPAEKSVAIRRTKNAAEFAAVYVGSLYLNQAILSASGSKDKINLTDPSKSDWLKHKIASHTVAVDGGLLSPIRLLGRLVYDTMVRPRKELRGDTRTTAAIKDIGNYAVGKASPSVSIAKEAMTAESFDGRLLPWSRDTSKKPRMTWTEYATSHGPIPLSGATKEIYDSMRERGLSSPDAKSYLRGLAAFGSELTGARVMEIQEPKPASNRNR